MVQVVEEENSKQYTMSMNLADMRSDYRRGRLRREDLKPDPILQFNLWLKEAYNAGVIEPTAMSLATAWSDGQPLVRRYFLHCADARSAACSSARRASRIWIRC